MDNTSLGTIKFDGLPELNAQIQQLIKELQGLQGQFKGVADQGKQYSNSVKQQTTDTGGFTQSFLKLTTSFVAGQAIYDGLIKAGSKFVEFVKDSSKAAMEEEAANKKLQTNAGQSSTSGTSGSSGTTGTSATSGTSGSSGTAGTSGTDGKSGTTGTSATSGTSGSSGTAGTTGTSGQSATSGTNGTTGNAGQSATSGTSGTNGANGVSGTNATSGTNGTSGNAGASATSGTSGTGGASGVSGTNATSGTNGTSGNSGTSATSGTNGNSGVSPTSGTSGTAGTSGAGTPSNTSGTSGTAGTSGGTGTSGTTVYGTSGTAGSSGSSEQVSTDDVYWYDSTNHILNVNNVKYITIPISDHYISGQLYSITAAATSAIGDVGYIDASGKVALCKADVIANCPYCMFICADASISANAAGNWMTHGSIRDDTWNWTVGGAAGVIYVSTTGTTGNTLTQTAPSGTNNVICPIGFALSADVIFFTGNMNTIEHT